MKKLLIPVFVLLLFVSACTPKKEKVWSELPEVTPLASLQHTAFAPTLEDTVDNQKNTIYAPAMLFAWNKMKEILGGKIELQPNNSTSFRLLTESTSHIKSLTDSEYNVSVLKDGDEFIILAFFNKTLPFEPKLQSLDEPVHFKNVPVKAFGIKNYDAMLAANVSILYYADEDHFIVRLSPKDKEHEILLAKGLESFTTLGDAVAAANKRIINGKKDQAVAANAWKYQLNEQDVLGIPKLKFNIKTNYGTLEGQRLITSDRQQHIIAEASQRTGLILDENGAVVESEATILVDSASGAPRQILPRHLLFNQPFVIIIKRTDQSNPYFVMHVANTELLQKTK